MRVGNFGVQCLEFSSCRVFSEVELKALLLMSAGKGHMAMIFKVVCLCFQILLCVCVLVFSLLFCCGEVVLVGVAIRGAARAGSTGCGSRYGGSTV